MGTTVATAAAAGVITAEMLAGITSSITTTITEVAPIGISAFALLVGLSLVPRVVRNFL